MFKAFRHCMEKRRRKLMENEFTYPDGSTNWFELSIEPVPEGIFVLSFDITPRKLTEAALIESEKRLIEAQRIAGMGDFTWDVGTGEVTWSEGLVALLKYDRNEKIDYSIVNAEILHPDDLERVTQWFKDCIASGENKLIPNEYRIFDREGNPIWVRTVGRIEREGGKDVRVFATVQDITESKLAEEVQERLRSQLIQSQKMESIGCLAGGVAHDMNNLLAPIIGFGEMLLEDLEPDDPRRNHVDQILSAGLRSRDLVRQLLAFSRKQALAFNPLNLNKTVRGFKKLLRRTIPEDIEIELLLVRNIKPVMADIGQIEQVIMNLAVNAADAMPEGGRLTIETALTDLDETYAVSHAEAVPGQYVMLALSDTGYGMDEGTRKRIFEPFFSTKGERGTGLGLATVYGIVKQHGGNIWIYSEKEKGTTFKIYLPVTEQARSEEPARSTEISNLKGSETIMLVEDNEEVLQLARTILGRLGYRVLAFNDSAESLAALDSFPGRIDLLLTDVVMPGINGRELYEKCAKIIHPPPEGPVHVRVHRQCHRPPGRSGARHQPPTKALFTPGPGPESP